MTGAPRTARPNRVAVLLTGLTKPPTTPFTCDSPRHHTVSPVSAPPRVRVAAATAEISWS